MTLKRAAKARDYMARSLVVLAPEMDVLHALGIFVEKQISGAPVLDRFGTLVGMLSEKDLLRLLYESQYLPGLVEDYMTSCVTSFDVEDELSVIHKHLVEHSFRRVPILYQGWIAGMITRVDLVRVYKERFRPETPTSQPTGSDEPLAEDAMHCGLLTVGSDTPLYNAMDMIARHHVTGLPVVDAGMNLLGIVTEKDLLDCVDKPEAIGASVEPFMTRNVVTFDRKASLNDICECLIENDFHRVPILDGTRLVGLISRSDILKHRIAVFKR